MMCGAPKTLRPRRWGSLKLYATVAGPTPF